MRTTKPGLAPFRAERRLGEMMTEQRKAQGCAEPNKSTWFETSRDGRGLSPPFFKRVP